jgi:hypothetical protein
MAGNSNSGGRRPGAGRKPGSKSRKSREAADKLAASGITPLEIMVARMRDEPINGKPVTDEQFEAAQAAAPYIHPRLSSVDAKVRRVTSWNELSDAELASLLAARSDGGTAEAPEGPREPDSVH